MPRARSQQVSLQDTPYYHSVFVGYNSQFKGSESLISKPPNWLFNSIKQAASWATRQHHPCQRPRQVERYGFLNDRSFQLAQQSSLMWALC